MFPYVELQGVIDCISGGVIDMEVEIRQFLVPQKSVEAAAGTGLLLLRVFGSWTETGMTDTSTRTHHGLLSLGG